MKRTIILTLILLITDSAMGQATPNRYEVEILKNPNAGRKDTREVNSVLIFEPDAVKIQSRRSNEIFKEFKYSDIKTAEHSYGSKQPFQMSKGTAIALSVLSGMPLFLLARNKDKHWLMVATDDDYAVLKIENDNYRMIRMEFIVKKVGIVDIDENK
jgi:hypothetical protein